jgi:hypothetical protein
MNAREPRATRVPSEVPGYPGTLCPIVTEPPTTGHGYSSTHPRTIEPFRIDLAVSPRAAMMAFDMKDTSGMPDFEPFHVTLDGVQYTVIDLTITTAVDEKHDARESSEKTRARIQRHVQRVDVTWESPSCQLRASAEAHAQHAINCNRSGAK